MSDTSLFPTQKRRIASILMPMPLPEPFDYEIPDDVHIEPGDHVLAPLGQRTVSGVVWAIGEETNPDRKLKPLDGLRGGPRLKKSVRDFIDWTAKYLVEPPGVVLRSVLRNPAALKPSPVETVYSPTGQPIARMTPARKAILAAVEDGPDTAAELARKGGVSSSVVKGLAEAGALAAKEVEVDPPFDPPDPYAPGLRLNEHQEHAARSLRQLVGAGGFQAALIDGVTGSGKTEVYFEAIAELLRREPDAQVLVLLPEIALTQTVTGRFSKRFGTEPALWHSSLSDKERRRVWREAASGRANIIAGARSSIFLPLPNLRAIIVDEEHDPTYKQSDTLTYNARDLAVARAKLSGSLCVLASATPSIESLVNAEAGRYHHVRLPGRAGGAVLPDIELLDLRLDPPEKGEWLSQPLIDAMRDTLQRGEQSLLYLNRRGFAPLVLCKSCGHKMKSPEADRWLVEHRYTGRLVCHVTGFSMPKPKLCPECKAEDSLIGIGPGVERVAEETAQKFPGARIEVFSSDTARSADAVRDLVERMEKSEIDILVGTQIAAKGHNFPNLTLVGVVDADLGLAGGDLRAGERTYQTLVQAAGRAGRADRPGRAILQTWKPDHEALQALAAGDRDAFLSAEKLMRETLGLPPYGRLAALILSAPDPALVDVAAQTIAAAAPTAEGVEVFGPAEPPLGVVRGRWRRRFLIQGQKNTDMSAYMRAWMGRIKPPSAVRIRVDIEPYSFL
jgi:primosomal protein N' (replication factor Y)